VFNCRIIYVLYYSHFTVLEFQISPKKNLGSPNSDVKICVDDADDTKEDVVNDAVDNDDVEPTPEENDEKTERQERTFITFSGVKAVI
jgi:hypothetical protein